MSAGAFSFKPVSRWLAQVGVLVPLACLYTAPVFAAGDFSVSDAIVLVDVDSDGDLDIVVGNYDAPDLVYLNDGHGSFDAGQVIDVWRGKTQGIAVGDVDGDGAPDLLMGNSEKGLPILSYRNDGAGGFVTGHDIDAGADYVSSLSLGDVDGDGDLDFVVVNHANVGRLEVYLNNGNGRFGNVTLISRVGIFTALATLVDVDDDGDLDVLEGRLAGGGARLYRNDGKGGFSGTFEEVGDGDNALAMVQGDVDSDGDLDLVIGASGTNMLYRNDGDGVFDAGHAIGAQEDDSVSVALGDVDGDGDLDLVVGNHFFVPNRLYLNDGAGRFDAGRDIGGNADNTLAVALGDLDGDGDLDLVTANGKDAPNRIYLNDGHGGFRRGQGLGTTGQ